MKHFDTFIIGGGLSGLFAALVEISTFPNHRIAICASGSGTLPLSSGTIDFLSHDDNGRLLKSPIDGIHCLPLLHPYSKIGLENLNRAIDFFKNFSSQYSLPYVGALNHHTPVITSLGTIKHATLAVPSMDASSINFAQKIVVVEIRFVKDFFAKVVADNLQKIFPSKTIQTVTIDLVPSGGRDSLILDVARLLDSNDGIQSFVDQLKSFASPNTIFVTPPIFGTKGASSHSAAESLLDSKICETTCLPPSPPSIRLRNIFRDALLKHGVRILDNVKIVDSSVSNNKALAVKSSTGKFFEANRFVLATGNFFGGGIQMNDFNAPLEPIFNLPVFFEPSEDLWSHEDFFAPQGFAKTGILVDQHLRPINLTGNLIFDNVFVIGNLLGAFDLISQGASSGVAISSAFKVGVDFDSFR